MTKLNARSVKNLDGVHEDLARVVMKAAEKCDFLVTEGLRSKERQAQLVKAGKSQTQNSRHLYGLAVDLCDCDGCYDVPDMIAISRAMKSAAAELGVAIQWGGDWKTFKDTPHFELDRKAYPDKGDRKPKVVAPSTQQAAKGAGVGAGIGIGGSIAAPYLPSIPVPSLPSPPSVEAVTQWQNTAETLNNFMHSQAIWIAVCGILIALIAPMLARRFA